MGLKSIRRVNLLGWEGMMRRKLEFLIKEGYISKNFKFIMWKIFFFKLGFLGNKFKNKRERGRKKEGR